MKPLKVGIWYLMLMVFPLAIFVFTYNNQSEFLRYDQQLWKYRFDFSFSPRTVLIGPSYVSNLGTDPSFYNLGYPAANPTEIEQVVSKYCRPTDNIILGIGPYHFLAMNEEPKQFPVSALVRYKIAIMDKISPVPDALNTEALNRIIDSRFAEISDADIIRSVESLKVFHEKHPNVRLVLFPILTVEAFPESKNVLPKNILFRDALLSSALPIIDLSDTVPADSYADLIHFSARANDLVKARLKKIPAH